MQEGNCVYIIKTSKRLYKIGKTKDLKSRISGYQTHLPIVFRVVRQYLATNMNELEEALHVVFQHKRVKGEWFELSNDELTICDNIARNYGFSDLRKQRKEYKKIVFHDDPMLQVMEANAKYLNDYEVIVEEIKMGMSTQEIIERHHENVDKTIIQTIRRILESQTPNSEYIIQWAFIVNDLQKGLNTKQILDKYDGKVTQNVIQTIKRILRNQLY